VLYIFFSLVRETVYTLCLHFFLRRYSPRSGLGRLVLRFLSHILSRAPLNEKWAHRRSRYLHNTQQTQDTNIHALSGIRVRGPSIQAGAEHIPPSPHGYRDPLASPYLLLFSNYAISANHLVPIPRSLPSELTYTWRSVT